ncbi:exocyst complex component exo70 [Podila humilis]|nr:exocyst complex component exo70 [Podila humilis]
MAISTDGVRDNKTFLDEEAAELDSLVASLEKTNTVSSKMVGILNSFDTRLAHLESSVLPIHKSTQNLTRLAGNMNQTVAALEAILGYFDLAAQEESIVMTPLAEQDLQTFLQSVGRIREALRAMTSVKLKAGERVVQQLKRSLKAASGQLHERLKQQLTQHSQPLDLKIVTSSDRKDIPSLPQHAVQSLVTLSKALAEVEADPNSTPTGYLKSYCEIRANCMIKSLAPLFQSSKVELRGVYDKGTSPFIPYTTSLLKLCRNEADLADTLLDAKLLSLAFMGSIMPPIEQWVETGRTITRRIRKTYTSEVGVLFDVIEALETSMNTFDSVFGTLNYVKRLMAYQPMVESVLTLIGDGNWNNPEAGANRRSQAANRSRSAIFQHYIADVLEALVQNIDSKSKFYKKGQSLTQLFLLNNYFYISKAVRTHPGLLDLINGPDATNRPAANQLPSAVYERPLKQNVDLYQDNWKPCVEHLMDVTYVHDGGVQHVLNSNQRQMVKDKFKNFNHDFDELWKTQKQYSIPDQDLRSMVLKDVNQIMIPMYEKFLNKYSSNNSSYEFTKNIQKYIRYDVSMVKDMVSQFFTNT